MHVLIFSAFTILGGGTANDEPAYEYKLRKPADTILAIKEKTRTVFVVTSPSGIGDGSIKLKSGPWPENVTFRFVGSDGKAFSNLERIDLTTDRLRVEGNLKLSGKFRFCFLDAKKTPAAIEPGKRESAGMLNVVVEKRADAFEVTLPACLLIGSTQVELSWVDEFRR